MGKTFSMSMYAGRDDMHRTMIEYIRELEQEKQAIKQRLIDAVSKPYFYVADHDEPVLYKKEVIELIEKEFSDK